MQAPEIRIVWTRRKREKARRALETALPGNAQRSAFLQSETFQKIFVTSGDDQRAEGTRVSVRVQADELKALQEFLAGFSREKNLSVEDRVALLDVVHGVKASIDAAETNGPVPSLLVAQRNFWNETLRGAFNNLLLSSKTDENKEFRSLAAKEYANGVTELLNDLAKRGNEGEVLPFSEVLEAWNLAAVSPQKGDSQGLSARDDFLKMVLGSASNTLPLLAKPEFLESYTQCLLYAKMALARGAAPLLVEGFFKRLDSLKEGQEQFTLLERQTYDELKLQLVAQQSQGLGDVLAVKALENPVSPSWLVQRAEALVPPFLWGPVLFLTDPPSEAQRAQIKDCLAIALTQTKIEKGSDTTGKALRVRALAANVLCTPVHQGTVSQGQTTEAVNLLKEIDPARLSFREIITLALATGRIMTVIAEESSKEGAAKNQRKELQALVEKMAVMLLLLKEVSANENAKAKQEELRTLVEAQKKACAACVDQLSVEEGGESNEEERQKLKAEREKLEALLAQANQAASGLPHLQNEKKSEELLAQAMASDAPAVEIAKLIRGEYYTLMNRVFGRKVPPEKRQILGRLHLELALQFFGSVVREKDPSFIWSGQNPGLFLKENPHDTKANQYVFSLEFLFKLLVSSYSKMLTPGGNLKPTEKDIPKILKALCKLVELTSVAAFYDTWAGTAGQTSSLTPKVKQEAHGLYLKKAMDLCKDPSTLRQLSSEDQQKLIQDSQKSLELAKKKWPEKYGAATELYKAADGIFKSALGAIQGQGKAADNKDSTAQHNEDQQNQDRRGSPPPAYNGNGNVFVADNTP